MLCTLLDMPYSLRRRQDLSVSCSNLGHMACTGSYLPRRYMCLLYMTCSQCSRWFGLETSPLDSPRKHLHQLPTKMFQLYCRVSSHWYLWDKERIYNNLLGM